MSSADPLNDALVNIKNHDSAAKRACSIAPASKLLSHVLRILHENGYIAQFEREENGWQGRFKIALNGKINDCKAIKPRYAVKRGEFERYEKRYLPSKDVGLLIVSTSRGVFTHRDAKKEKIGGRLLAYVY
jgi:small subunit ribosomal protein S8